MTAVAVMAVRPSLRTALPLIDRPSGPATRVKGSPANSGADARKSNPESPCRDPRDIRPARRMAVRGPCTTMVG